MMASSFKGTDKKAKGSKPLKPSHGEVFASAHVVMNAAKNKFHSPLEDISYGKLAGAAGTLIGAASHYGKLKKTSFGKYANKAQAYLHSYEIEHSKSGMSTVPPPQPSAHTSSEVNHSQPSAARPQGYPAGYTSSEINDNQPSTPPPQRHPPSMHTTYEVNHSQPYARPDQGYPAGYAPPEVNHSQPSAPPQGYPAGCTSSQVNHSPQGYPAGYTYSQVNHSPQGYPARDTSSQVNHSQPSAARQGYPAGYTSSQVNHSQPSAPPQGYPAGYTSSQVNRSQPSAPPQGYPAGYPTQGYPADAQQNYGYGPQAHSKLTESHVTVHKYPPVGYPPVHVDNYPPVYPPTTGYPISDGNYN